MAGNANVNLHFIRPVQEAFERANLLDEVKMPAVALNFGFIQFGVEWKDGSKDFHLTEVNLNETKAEELEAKLQEAAAKCAADLIGKRRADLAKQTCLCGHHQDSHDVFGTGRCESGTCPCQGFKSKEPAA